MDRPLIDTSHAEICTMAAKANSTLAAIEDELMARNTELQSLLGVRLSPKAAPSTVVEPDDAPRGRGRPKGKATSDTRREQLEEEGSYLPTPMHLQDGQL